MKFFNIFILIIFFHANAQESSSFPKVDLETLEFETFNTAELLKKDNPVIITFWATWCGPCIRELSAINEVYTDWQDETGVELYAVSIDDSRGKRRVKPMVNGKGWEYEVLLDENQEFFRGLNGINPPYTLLLYKGEIVHKHVGYSPGAEDELYAALKQALEANEEILDEDSPEIDVEETMEEDE